MPEQLLPVRKQDLQLDQPVPYAVFDPQGTLLVSAGQVIRNAELLSTLQTLGHYANPQWNALRKPAGAGGARVVQRESSAPAAAPARVADAPQADRKVLPELKLQPGTWLQLGESGSGGRPKTSVRLIGWVDKLAVFLSSVNAQGAVLPFREGETLSLRTLAGRDVVAFSCTVNKVTFTPVPHVILTFPEQIQRQQLRKGQRVDIDVIASLTVGDAMVPARIINLSAGGAMLVSTAVLHAGTAVQLAFRLPAAGIEHTLAIKAEVRNASRADGQAGVEFLEPGMMERLLLEHYIFHTLLEN